MRIVRGRDTTITADLQTTAELSHVYWKLRQLLAHFRHGAMSGLSPECASDRTSLHRYGAIL